MYLPLGGGEHLASYFFRESASSSDFFLVMKLKYKLENLFFDDDHEKREILK